MKSLQSVLLGLAIVVAAASVPAQVFPVVDDTAGPAGSQLITRGGGRARTLVVSAHSNAYLAFDQGDTELDAASVLAAQLTLYLPAVLREGSLGLHLLASNFSEDVWGAPVSAPLADPAFLAWPLSKSMARDFVVVDVTAAVKALLAVPGAQLAFALTSVDGAVCTVSSKEGAAHGHPATLELVLSPSISASNLENGSVTSSKLATGLSLGGTTALTGALSLPLTTNATTGLLLQDGLRLLHTYGSGNVFLGANAGTLTNTGHSNVALGQQALDALGSGQSNTAVGSSALSDLTSGSRNTGLGVATLQGNSIGWENAALGYLALANTTGSRNTAMGQGAGRLLTSGNDNICIGYEVTGTAAESNVTRLGAASQLKAFMGRVRGKTTGLNDAVPVVIDSAGQLGTVSSSLRFKQDVQDMGVASARLDALRPVTFRYARPFADGSQPTQYGLIAEEVAAAFPELAVCNAEGQPETVKYQDLVPLLLNEFQRERRRNDALAQQLEAQASRLDGLAAELAALRARESSAQ